MNLEAMSDNDLGNLYRNCLAAILQDKPTKARAQEIIEEINAVWQARLSAAVKGDYKAESPEIGVLKTIGYHVGNDGPRTQARWRLLDYVMSNVLPFVGSPAHMHEWGEPNSLTRYRKLHRALASFRTRAGNQPHLVESHRKWDEDIDYIEREWKPKFR